MLEKDLVRQGDLDLLSGQCQWIEEKFGTRVTILVFQGAALARQTLDKNIIEDPVLLWPKTFELQNRFDQGEMLTPSELAILTSYIVATGSFMRDAAILRLQELATRGFKLVARSEPIIGMSVDKTAVCKRTIMFLEYLTLVGDRYLHQDKTH